LPRGKAGDGVHANRGASVFMGEGNFEAIRKARKINLQMRMLASQMFEGFQARLDDRGLQPRNRVTSRPAASAKKRATPPTAAANRASASMHMCRFFGSVATALS